MKFPTEHAILVVEGDDEVIGACTFLTGLPLEMKERMWRQMQNQAKAVSDLHELINIRAEWVYPNGVREYANGFNEFYLF